MNKRKRFNSIRTLPNQNHKPTEELRVVNPSQQKSLIQNRGNSYRGGGEGAYPHSTKDNRIPVPFVDVRLELQDLLNQGVTSASLPDSPWRFSNVAENSVQFETGPKAKNHLPNTLRKQLKRLEINKKGFVSFRLSLETP